MGELLGLSSLASPLMVLLLAVVGFLLRKTRLRTHLDTLGKINIYFFLTVVLSNSFYRKGIEISDAQISVSYIFFATVSLAILIPLLRELDPPTRASIISSSLFPNAVNLAFPVLQATRGNYSYASVYAVTAIVFQSIVVPFLGGTGNALSYSLRGLTPVLGIPLGLLLRELGINGHLSFTFGLLSDIGILMFSFVAGLSIPVGNKWVIDKRIALIGTWRILVSPAMHLAPFLLLLMLGYPLNHEALVQTLVEAVMPPALVNISYAIALRFNVELSISSVVVLTPLGAVAGAILGLSL